MASLTLKNIKKIYPHNGDDAKKQKKNKKKDDQPEKKVNLQITAEGVVAVQEFNLEIKDKEFIVLVVLPVAVSPPPCVWSQAWKTSPAVSCTSATVW